MEQGMKLWKEMNDVQPMCKGVASGDDVTAGGGGSQRGRGGRGKGLGWVGWVGIVSVGVPHPWSAWGHF